MRTWMRTLLLSPGVGHLPWARLCRASVLLLDHFLTGSAPLWAAVPPTPGLPPSPVSVLVWLYHRLHPSPPVPLSSMLLVQLAQLMLSPLLFPPPFSCVIQWLDVSLSLMTLHIHFQVLKSLTCTSISLPSLNTIH